MAIFVLATTKCIEALCMILAFKASGISEEEENNNEKPSGRMTFPGPQEKGFKP